MAKRKHPLNALKVWMRSATPDEQVKLADAAHTSRGALYQVASGHRQFRPGKAGLLEDAAEQLRAINPTLPTLYKTDLAPECASCKYARACLGDVVLRSEFPIVGEGE